MQLSKQRREKWQCGIVKLLCIARSIRLRSGGNLSLFQPAVEARGQMWTLKASSWFLRDDKFSKEQSLFHWGRMGLTRKFHDNEFILMQNQLIKPILRRPYYKITCI